MEAEDRRGQTTASRWNAELRRTPGSTAEAKPGSTRTGTLDNQKIESDRDKDCHASA